MKALFILTCLISINGFSQFTEGRFGPDIVLSSSVQFVNEHDLETGPQSPSNYPRYELVHTSQEGFFYLVKVKGDFKMVWMKRNLNLEQVYNLNIGEGITFLNIRQIQATKKALHITFSGKNEATPKKMVGLFDQQFVFDKQEWNEAQLIENYPRKQIGSVSVFYHPSDSLRAICNLENNDLQLNNHKGELVYEDVELRPQDDKLEELKVKDVKFGKTSELYILFEERIGEYNPQTDVLKQSDCIALAAYDEEGGKIERFEKEKNKHYTNAKLIKKGDSYDAYYQWLDDDDRNNTGIARIQGANVVRDQLFTFNVDTDELFIERVGNQLVDLNKIYNYASKDQFRAFFSVLFAEEKEGVLTLIVQKQTAVKIEFGNSNTGTSAKGASGTPTDGFLDNTMNTFTATGDIFLLKLDKEFNVKDKKKVEKEMILELERDNHSLRRDKHFLSLYNFGKMKNQSISDPKFYGRPTVLNELKFDLINYTYTIEQTAIHNHKVPVKLMLATMVVEDNQVYVLGARAGHENLATFKLP